MSISPFLMKDSMLYLPIYLVYFPERSSGPRRRGQGRDMRNLPDEGEISNSMLF